ncbi:hypothetical protein TNCV_1692501 [Trichonephila clavipes]|nr:hypothetical protein TNCV_1692501 [Trichonephila clavipes]
MSEFHSTCSTFPLFHPLWVAAVAEWYRYRTVACLVMSSSPVPLKTRRVGTQGHESTPLRVKEDIEDVSCELDNGG